eukprot:474902-Prymnesium_polylepis.1
MFNCTDRHVATDCLYSRFSKALQEFLCRTFKTEKPLMNRLNSTELIVKRLLEAQTPNTDPAGRPRFTFIPAAVGGKDGSVKILWRGMLSGWPSGLRHPPAYMPAQQRVRTIDFVKWLCDSFQKDDYVVVKMDIEGSEHTIFSRMFNEPLPMRNSSDLIDLLVGECHGERSCRGWRHQMYRRPEIWRRFAPFFWKAGLPGIPTPEHDNHSRPEVQKPVEIDETAQQCHRSRAPKRVASA